MSLNQEIYDALLEKTLSYFFDQWVNSDFSHWQIFRTPAGIANTNNPLDLYNGSIKDDFTKRLKRHLKTIVVHLTTY